MSRKYEKVVMDVLPFPQGRGFTGAHAWWDYILSKGEQKKLDNLLGLALLDEGLRDRLVTGCDESLFEAFALSKETGNWLRSIHATSLTELAEAILAAPKAITAQLEKAS